MSWQKWLSRLNTTDFLERLRGKKLVFVGDSLNRNMWESLVCALRHGVADKTRVYEISGRHEFKKKGFYAFLFEVCLVTHENHSHAEIYMLEKLSIILWL